MASVWKHPASKYWYANFKKADGRYTNRSTRVTDRKKALKIAHGFEEVAMRKMSEEQVRRVISGLYKELRGESLESSTVREFLKSWCADADRSTSVRTSEKYRKIADQLLTYLGPKADEDISLISKRDLEKFRNGMEEKVSISTANNRLKILRIAFRKAFRDGLICENLAERFQGINKRRENTTTRRAFTWPELTRLVEAADLEWKGMILVGLYTGQRLGDIARLTWQNLDLVRQELRLVTGKTGRIQIIPLATPLQRFFETEMPSGDNPKAPLFPSANDVVLRQNRVGTLSGRFYALMAEAGLVEPRKHVRTGCDQSPGSGRDGRRRLVEISFHALRHTTTSLMKNAGISPAIVQDVIGHESKAVSANYTHIEESAKRRAVEAIPDVLA